MKRVVLTLSMLTLVAPSFVLAKDVQLASPQERVDYIRRADTWIKPSWIDSSFNFDPAFDIKALSNGSEVENLLTSNEVYCKMTHELATQDRGLGKTEKFFCELMKRNGAGQLELVVDRKGKAKKIKVKYGDNNKEIIGEVLATRLLRALGFGADRMFPVQQVKCFGCTADPFKIRQLDTTTLTEPRVFNNVAIEIKMHGEEIKIRSEDLVRPEFAGAKAREGWSYDQVLGRSSYSTDVTIAREQIMERDALMVIAGFIRHTDNKISNQRLSCTGEVSEDGKCLGSTLLLLQDVGYTFGGNIINLAITKVDLGQWRRAAVWMDEESRRACTLNTGLNWSMSIVNVTEEGRLLAGTLLKKFVEGSAGRKRLEDLFRVAGIERAGGTLQQWMDTFLMKTEEVLHPQLSDNARRDQYYPHTRETLEDRREQPEIHCPRNVESVLRRLRN